MRTSEFRKLAGATAAVALVDPSAAPATDVFVSYDELPQHGIPKYSRVHIRRMIARGVFPAAIQLSPNRVGWRLSDIVAWKRSRPTAPVPAAGDAA